VCSMLGILLELPEIWIQLQSVWEMMDCEPSASMRQCTQQEYRISNYDTKVSEKCYGACRMCIAC